MKALGIDFGEKRVGLALSDVGGAYAMPWKTLERQSDQQLIAELVVLTTEEAVERVVVGNPLGLDGTAGPQARRVASFIKKLKAALEVEIETVNESLTSHEAEKRLRSTGHSPRRRRELVDALAAQILLQEYLDGRRDSQSG